uniref:Uncharacterized protein n=1 Tax=Rhizophora mucronata TaxID=61149 RepID=A0A2P2P7B0_RHIMU
MGMRFLINFWNMCDLSSRQMVLILYSL